MSKLLVSLAGMAAMAVGAAHAQTYDVDITLGSWAFDGTMTYSSGLLSNVDVSDGWTNGATHFATGTVQGGNFVDLVDYEGAAPHPTSQIWQLSFDTSAPLGSPTMNVSNVLLNIDNNSTGLYQCGSSLSCGGRLTEVRAPEIDWLPASAAMTLLIGGILVIKSSKVRA